MQTRIGLCPYTWKEGLTDRDRLAWAIVEHTSVLIDFEQAHHLMAFGLERCVEVYYGVELAGYLLIFNINGERSFHGYNLLHAPALTAFRMAKEFLRIYDKISIFTTGDKVRVRHLARMLGFKETVNINIVKMERTDDTLPL